MLNALMLDTDGQRLGDDSMEGVAADLLLADGNDGGSLFNDSLDEDSHAATTKTTSTAAASPVHQQHDLNDSLSFDTTQLPFDNDTAEPLTHSSSKAGNDVPVETKRPTAGFELAKNISISRPTELERKGKQYSVDIESAVATKVPEPYAGDDSNIKLSTSSSATLPTASKTGASTKAKSPKVVPSFGRRKAKTSPHKAITEGNKSPNSDSTSDSMVPVGNLVADDRDIPNDRQDNEGGERVIEGDDQYVPQTSTGNNGKPQKASKKKTPPQQTTTATKDSGQGKKSVASKKTGMPKIPSVGAVDDQNMTNEGESVPHNTTTTDKEDQDGLSADKTSSKRQSSLKGKKLAEREEKKRERDEKKREAEQKKLEREQKKLEAEAMKAEKERLKKERQLELERKKAEKEQKRIELALKKAERMTSKKEGKQTGAKGSRKSKQSDDSNAAEGHTGSSLVVEQSSDDRETEMNEMEKVPDRTDGNPDQMETKPHQMGNESDQLQIELEQMEDDPDQEVDRKNNDRDRQEPVQNPNQEEGNEKVRSNEKSVAGVTAPEEGASLATDPSNTNTTTNHPLPASITSLGYGHSTPGTQSQEPSESAAILPDDAADEGACNIPTSGDTNSVGDDPAGEGPVSSQGQSPEDTSTLQPSTVLKERNTASDGKVKIVFGKMKTTTQKKDEAKATTQHTKSLKPTQAEKKRNSAPKKTSRQLKPNTASTTSKENDKSLPRRKRSRTSSPKPKKRARAQEKNNRPGSSGGGGEGKREGSSNSGVGPVWVQCEKASCQKWRKLGDCSDPLSLPDSWTCSMNTGRHSTHTVTLQIQDNLFIRATWFCPILNKGHL